MPTINCYAKLLQGQGFTVGQKLDWSTNVEKTWSVGLTSLRAFSFLKIFTMSGWRGLLFGKQARLMQEAFSQDRVKYGVFLAGKS